MKNVSAAFKAAAVSATIQPARKVTLVLADNSIANAGITPTGNSVFATDVGPFKAANGLTSVPHKWASADPINTIGSGEIVPDGTWYPCDNLIETGYWGSIVSDGSGNISGGEDLVLSYNPAIEPTLIEVWFDATLGYAKDYVVSYDTGTGSYTTLATVTGNTNLHNTYAVPASTFISKIKIHVTKISKVSRVTKILEFAATYSVDVTDKLSSADILLESSPSNATVEIGNIAAGEATLAIEDTVKTYSPSNANSQAAQYARDNRKIIFQFGFILPDTTTEYCDFGTFYTTNFQSGRTDGLTSITAQDRLKILRDTKCLPSALRVNKTVDQLIILALQELGFSSQEYVINVSSFTIPYAWNDVSQTYFAYISSLVQAAGGVFYVDESNKFHFEDSVYLRLNSRTSQITLTDATSAYSIKNIVDTWDVGNLRNKIIVDYSGYSISATQTIWSSTNTINVPHDGSVQTLDVEFNDPVYLIVSITSNNSNVVVTNIDPFTGIDSNTSAKSTRLYIYQAVTPADNPTEVVTSITITGKILVSDSQSTITTEDSASVGNSGTKPLTISNLFIQTKAVAQYYSGKLLGIYKNPPPQLDLECVGLPHLERGDRVTVVSSTMGINADYFVIRHDFGYDGSFTSNLSLLYALDLPPNRATIWATEYTLSGATTDVNSVNTSYQYNFYRRIAADYITFSVFLSMGYYTMNSLGMIGTGVGSKINWYVNDDYQIKEDWTTGSASAAIVASNTVFIPFDGYHVFKGVIQGGGNELRLTKVWFTELFD